MDGINLIILIAVCGVAALGLTYWVGYTQGKDAANRTTFAALNTLVDSWNLLIRRMQPEDRGPTLSRARKTPKGNPEKAVREITSDLISH